MQPVPTNLKRKHEAIAEQKEQKELAEAIRQSELVARLTDIRGQPLPKKGLQRNDTIQWRCREWNGVVGVHFGTACGVNSFGELLVREFDPINRSQSLPLKSINRQCTNSVSIFDRPSIAEGPALSFADFEQRQIDRTIHLSQQSLIADEQRRIRSTDAQPYASSSSPLVSNAGSKRKRPDDPDDPAMIDWIIEGPFDEVEAYCAEQQQRLRNSRDRLSGGYSSATAAAAASSDASNEENAQPIASLPLMIIAPENLEYANKWSLSGPGEAERTRQYHAARRG